ncbi:MAG: Ribosomal RNA small subunit methyltransferase E [Candidatus Saccharicenans subterraneus]|uniref:Ribosomal RNA small subunit methyltransferase E n=1 Tax=Candidatus Saccharicenans subterraneus TaxID=2508984 RepID=A0A3E2BNA5_9BACT|nr:MAG: Ribosomal RNA small subunit methyltransferase E [Candidatus Saccharicenans subterraneum]
MTSNQFFIREWPAGLDRFCLEGQEHHHLSRVARVKPGNLVWLTDGRGRRLLAEVEFVEEERTWLRPLKTKEEAIKTRVILGLGLTRPAVFDFIIEKATELGVSEIQPLMTRRSQPLPPDRLDKKIQRWERIAREALKQCKGGSLPHIGFPLKLEQAVGRKVNGSKFYLSEDSPRYFRDILIEDRTDEIFLLAGPEGGWTEEEKELLDRAGFQGLSLGSRILKTETAVISALSLISHFWNW